MSNNVAALLKYDLAYSEDFLVRSVFNSAAIENNTITLDETRTILIDNLLPSFKRGVTIREFYELMNLKKAWTFVLENYDKTITISLMHELHRIIMDNIDDEAGRFKRSSNMEEY